MKKILLVLTTALVLAACSSTKVEDEAAKREKLQELKQQAHDIEQQISVLEKELSVNEEKEVIKVKAVPVTTQKFEHFIEVTGTVEADEDVNVAAETAGIIDEVLVTEGQNVRKGQVLARINTDVLERSVDELQVQLDLAKTNYQRQKNLWDQNVGSEMEYLRAKNNMESLEKRIASLQTQIDLAEIKSPADGVVDVVYQKKGNIGSPQTPFAKVVNISHLKIYGDVSESYLTKVHTGDNVLVRFPALNTEQKASIAQIGNVIDPNNRTFRIRINLNNPDKSIKPNLISVLRLRDYVNENAIVVPALYIKEDFSGHYTYIVEKNGSDVVAKKIYVTPGVSDNNLTEVTKGMQEGMLIVSEGYNQIADGTLVQLN
ncbi:MAG TPA: efflux RND transporter periplasmic adaptor subunit [Draconibacterium sp.]|nr:efflux RND transporter periplasmic adaptor subunit [Draconibacterium sp.]